MTIQLPSVRRDAAAAMRLRYERDPRITTMAAAIRAAAEHPVEPDNGCAVVLLGSQGAEQRLTYPELWNASRMIAAGLRARGVERGDRVLLLLPTSDAYVITLCATIILGAIPCTIAAPTLRSKTDDSLRYLGYASQKLAPALLVVPDNIREAVQEHPAIEAQRVVTFDELQSAGIVPVESLPAIEPTDVHHIQLTSGSTSAPKGVVLTHANVLANLQAIAHAIEGMPGEDSGLSWLPLYHDMGLIQLLMAIYYQSTIVLMSPSSFIRNPLSWLTNIARYGSSFSAGPTFGYSLCIRKFDPEKLKGLDLSCWRRTVVGAEPVPLNIIQEFTQRYQPYGLSDHTVFPCYGMAETVLATTVPIPIDHPNRVFGFVACDCIDPEALRRENRAVPIAQNNGTSEAPLDVIGCGHAARGLEVAILDENDRVLADREVGEICARGTSVMQGYFNDPEASAAALRNGWYHTGDRGYLVDGELYVLGRIKELVIVRGRNYQPDDIEAVIEEHGAVRQGYTVVFGVFNARQGTDDVVVVAETKAPAEEHPAIVQQTQQALQQAFGFVARDIVLVPHGTVPRTTSGKRQRVRTQEWYSAGKLAHNGANVKV